MASDAEFFKSIGIDLDESSQKSKLVPDAALDLGSTAAPANQDNTERIKINETQSILPSTLALATVTVTSVVFGFLGTLALKKRDGASLDKAILPRRGMSESGTKLAFRALGWGTFYAMSGFSAVSFLLYQMTKYRLLQFEERREAEKTAEQNSSS